MKPKLVDLYYKFAQDVANLSYARRLKVGAVIVNAEGNRIMSFGYNGTPPGYDNNCEDEVKNWEDSTLTAPRLVTKEIVIHAEMNAILKIARTTDSCEGAVLFMTHAPCVDCAKHIIMSGIKRVHYIDDYRSLNGVSMLNESGVITTKRG